MGNQRAPKPLHWSDSFGQTLCGFPTKTRRYVGKWNRPNEKAAIGEITCDICNTKLKARNVFTTDPQPAPYIAEITKEPEPPMNPLAPATTIDTTELEQTMQAIAAIKSTARTEPVASLSFLGTLGDQIQAYVDQRSRVIAEDVAIEALSTLGPTGVGKVDWTVNTQPFATIEGTHHKALPEILNRIACGFKNFYIVGPTQSGKTTLAADVAKALDRRFASISCSAGMSESQVLGRGIPNLTTGKNEYVSTEYVDIYENGGVFLFDEGDAADSNMLIVLNSGTANGHMTLPNRVEKPRAERHENCVIIVAANTYGTGADRQYVGRNQLDAAFMERFVGAMIEVDYDRDLESSIIGDANICARVWTIRDKVRDLKLRRSVSTLFLKSVTRLVKGAGMTIDNALKACTVGWTQDELTRAGVL